MVRNGHAAICSSQVYGRSSTRDVEIANSRTSLDFERRSSAGHCIVPNIQEARITRMANRLTPLGVVTQISVESLKPRGKSKDLQLASSPCCRGSNSWIQF